MSEVMDHSTMKFKEPRVVNYHVDEIRMDTLPPKKYDRVLSVQGGIIAVVEDARACTEIY